MTATRITVTRRDRKVSLRLTGVPPGAIEGICITTEEAQCAANAILRMPKDNRKGSMRFGALTLMHFPNHHQPVELRYANADWSIIVDLSRTDSYNIADMLRGAGLSDRPFDGEMDLQFPLRVKDHRRVPLPASLMNLLNESSERLEQPGEDDPAQPRICDQGLSGPKSPTSQNPSARQDPPAA